LKSDILLGFVGFPEGPLGSPSGSSSGCSGSKLSLISILQCGGWSLSFLLEDSGSVNVLWVGVPVWEGILEPSGLGSVVELIMVPVKGLSAGELDPPRDRDLKSSPVMDSRWGPLIDSALDSRGDSVILGA